MKKLLLGILVLGSLTSYAGTLCNFFCVKTLSAPLEDPKVVDITSTLLSSEENNIMKVIATEANAHCDKISNGSRAIGELSFRNDGTLKVQELNDTTIRLGEGSCINF